MVPILGRRRYRPIVLAKHPVETFLARDRASAPEATATPVNQTIIETAMVSFALIMLDVLANDSAKRKALLMHFGDRDERAIEGWIRILVAPLGDGPERAVFSPAGRQLSET